MSLKCSVDSHLFLVFSSPIPEILLPFSISPLPFDLFLLLLLYFKTLCLSIASSHSPCRPTIPSIFLRYHHAHACTSFPLVHSPVSSPNVSSPFLVSALLLCYIYL